MQKAIFFFFFWFKLETPIKAAVFLFKIINVILSNTSVIYAVECIFFNKKKK